MANKPLKSIKFPGLDDTYTVPQIDSTLSVAGKAADAKAAGDQITELKNDVNNLNAIIPTSLSIKMQYQQGRFLNNGFSQNAKYCRNINALPAGKYKLPAYSTYSHLPVEYISDSEGVFLTSGWITGETIIESTNPIYINFSKTTDWGASDLSTLSESFIIERINDESIESTLSTVISDYTQVTDVFGEVYIINSNEDCDVRRVTITDGVGDIAIGDVNDWVCYRSFPADAPAAVGKVYEIPQYNNSGATAYIVLKTATASLTSSTHTYLFNDPVYHLWKMPTIENYFSSLVKGVSGGGVSDQKVVFLGDSIFGNERSGTSIPDLVGNYTGARTYNCALGGTEGNTHGDAVWSYFDFTELSKAIANNSYTNQVAHESDTGVPSYFATVFDTLESIDFSEIDLICLTYGGNDYAMSHSDVNTFVVAMETNINRILTAYPNLRFMIMNPTYKMFLDSSYQYVDDGDTHLNSFGKTLKDYAESYKTISTAIHVPYIDAYNDLGINRYNASQWFISNDGSHPSEQGRKETAKLIAQYLKRMLYD